MKKFKNIEAERVRNGYSKEQLAQLIGVTTKTYYNWISEEYPIPSNALIKMADMFDVTTDYLLGRERDEKNR